jgi:hypothetical protein
MNMRVSTLGKTAPAEKRRKPDFHCDACGEEWDAPGHMFWLCRMYCVCGEVVEAR